MSCGQLLLSLVELRQDSLRKEASCTSPKRTLVSDRGDPIDRRDMMSQPSASPFREKTVTWLMTTNFRSRLSEPVSVDPTLQTHPGVYLSLRGSVCLLAATTFHYQWSNIIYLRRWVKWADTRTLLINLRRVFGQLGSRIQAWKKQCAREENQLSRRNYVTEIRL